MAILSTARCVLWRFKYLITSAFALTLFLSCTTNTTPAFKDCDDCPLMLSIPAGSFTMGSKTATDIPDDETPPRVVTIMQPFAMSQTEVTQAHYAAFVAATGRAAGDSCFTWDEDGQAGEFAERSWQDPGFVQGDDHPVTCVTWHDAVAYVDWLSQTTGARYRLPSEAEWEYAAFAGGQDTYFGGEGLAGLCAHGNIADLSAARALGVFPEEQSTEASFDLPDEFALQGPGYKVPWHVANCEDGYGLTTSPVAQFQANAFGLHDMLGNVWEWTQDCFEEGYQGAPTDGSAVKPNADCSLKSARGGAWAMNADGWRIADRDRDGPGRRYSVVGFRVARALD